MLHEFIATHREEIVSRCHAKRALSQTPSSTDAVVELGVPLLLDQLVSALCRSPASSTEIGRSASQHGHRRLLQGVTVSQVVHDYGDVRQAIAQLAVELSAPITTEDFGALNDCMDDAIAAAVTGYGRAHDASVLDREETRGSERLGFFAHELRNMVSTAIMAFEVLRTGDVGVVGSTGTVLHRSLLGLRGLIARSLVEIRLTQGIQDSEAFPVSAFIDEIAAAAALDANHRGIGLTVVPVESDVVVEADRQVLAAVVGNLLQNACKFTRPDTTVTLRVGGSADRVLIEVEDECGGLPAGDVNDLFRPFTRHGTDRTGVGLGLAFSRWGAEANRGRLSARNLPERGCVFTLDLPRRAESADPAV